MHWTFKRKSYEHVVFFFFFFFFFFFKAIETFPRIFNDSYCWPAIIHLIRLCNTCYKIVLRCGCYQKNAYFHSVCLVSMSLCYTIGFEKEIQLLLGQSYMFGNVIIWYVQLQKKKKKKKKKNDRTNIPFYFWFSYTSYTVCTSIVKCWWKSIYHGLGSTVCILTTNFNSRRYKPISLSCYVTYIT